MKSKKCRFCKKKFCPKHNPKRQLFCNRECFSNSIRGKFNNHKVEGNIVKFFIKGKKVLINLEDLKKVQRTRWHLANTGYPSSVFLGKRMLLHNLILQVKVGLVVDHVNRNKLDNRKNNLRLVTPKENCRNGSLPKTNTSGYRGVTWCKKDKRWKARLSLNDRTINLGQFKDIKDAVTARKVGEIKYWGKNYL